jgi:DNA-binding transcriptional regulator YhcF (GntR family)
MKKKRKRIDFLTKQNIIRERFVEVGSLEEKQNPPSFRKIGRKLKVNDRTVNSIINRYKKLNGKLFPNPMDRKNKLIDPWKGTRLNQEDIDYILDPARI